ncbi:MAG: DUF5131 family protein [Acidobacteria bacterium]|nr:DUF5131 family protein [Acidobacteriota bacterium]
MAKDSLIQWTEHTYNPWQGCQKVSPGCDNCLSPDTHVLYADMAWRPIGEVRPGDVLFAFDEHATTGRFSNAIGCRRSRALERPTDHETGRGRRRRDHNT